MLRMIHVVIGNVAPSLYFLANGGAGRTMSNNTILKALERMGYKGKHTGHGFQGVASTLLHEHGFNHEHIELQLAHAPRNAVSASYNHALYLQAAGGNDARLGRPFGADAARWGDRFNPQPRRLKHSRLQVWSSDGGN